MADPQASLNGLLKWGIENSADPVAAVRAAAAPAEDGPSTASEDGNAARRSDFDPSILDAILGGPSDADLMRASMAAIQDPSVTLDNKLVAFDNFEQLVEGLDNANNMGALDLWSPLVELLSDPEPKLRFMAAWCVGTAVQNNEKAQETAVVVGALPKLVQLAITGRPSPDQRADSRSAQPNEDIGQEERDVMRKACYAVSSAIRNCQPAARAILQSLPADMAAEFKDLDASDMDAVDRLMGKLRSFSRQ